MHKASILQIVVQTSQLVMYYCRVRAVPTVGAGLPGVPGPLLGAGPPAQAAGRDLRPGRAHQAAPPPPTRPVTRCSLTSLGQFGNQDNIDKIVLKKYKTCRHVFFVFL